MSLIVNFLKKAVVATEALWNNRVERSKGPSYTTGRGHLRVAQTDMIARPAWKTFSWLPEIPRQHIYKMDGVLALTLCVLLYDNCLVVFHSPLSLCMNFILMQRCLQSEASQLVRRIQTRTVLVGLLDRPSLAEGSSALRGCLRAECHPAPLTAFYPLPGL